MTNKKDKNKEFERLFTEAQQMRKRYMLALAAHKIYTKFNKLTAINIVGKKKAGRNVKILGLYNYFFTTAKEAARCYFLIELAKFFDDPRLEKCNKTRTVYWTLDYAQKNIHRLTKKEFEKYHESRNILPEILATYKELKLSDLRKIEKRLKSNENKIERLKTYRDTVLVHDDLKKKKVTFSVREMEVLLKIAHDAIELFYNKLEFASNSYKNFEEEPIRDIERVVEHLTEHEKQRLEEIKKTYS